MRISLLLLSLSLTGASGLMPLREAEPGALTLADVVNSVFSSTGVRLAGAIRAKQRHVAGVITAVANASFEILSDPRAKEQTCVRFGSDTVFLDSVVGDLEPGRDADIIGVRLRNGDVLAVRVIIYEGDCPLRTPDGAILFRARTDGGHGTGSALPSPCSSNGGSL